MLQLDDIFLFFAWKIASVYTHHMASAAVFTLITDNGRQDRLLCATEFLHRRLEKIKEIRKRPGSGFRDPNPTLADIEQTHILKVIGNKR